VTPLALIAAGLSAATAFAVTPEAGRYVGFVDPFPMSLKVEKGKISDLRTDFEATTCSGLAPAEAAPYFVFPTLAIKRGSFTRALVRSACRLAPPS